MRMRAVAPGSPAAVIVASTTNGAKSQGGVSIVMYRPTLEGSRLPKERHG